MRIFQFLIFFLFLPQFLSAQNLKKEFSENEIKGFFSSFDLAIEDQKEIFDSLKNNQGQAAPIVGVLEFGGWNFSFFADEGEWPLQIHVKNNKGEIIRLNDFYTIKFDNPGVTVGALILNPIMTWSHQSSKIFLPSSIDLDRLDELNCGYNKEDGRGIGGGWIYQVAKLKCNNKKTLKIVSRVLGPDALGVKFPRIQFKKNFKLPKDFYEKSTGSQIIKRQKIEKTKNGYFSDGEKIEDLFQDPK